MVTLIVNLSILNAIILFIENILSGDDVKKIQKDLDKWKSETGKEKTSTLIQKCNSYYNKLFETIYTNKFFSFQFLSRSVISSLIALVMAYTLVMIYRPSLVNSLRFSLDIKLIGGFLVLFIINIIADVISLAETKFIFRKTEGKSLKSIIKYLILDFILTSTIYLLVFFSVVGITNYDIDKNLNLKIDNTKQQEQLVELSKKEIIALGRRTELMNDLDSIRQIQQSRNVWSRLEIVFNLEDSVKKFEEKINLIRKEKSKVDQSIIESENYLLTVLIFTTFSSTYFTSLTFYLFAISTIIIFSLKRNSNRINRIIEWFVKQDKPFTKLAGIISALLLLLNNI